MSAISANSLRDLQQIAKMAYGSGRTEKTGGGNGYIGQIGNRVVKFATHGGERPFGGLAVTADMTKSCNALRTTLAKIARETLARGSKGAAAQDELAGIYKSLGLTKTGALGKDLCGKKSLLSRKVVARTLAAIENAANRNATGTARVDVWSAAKTATAQDRHALTMDDTSFETVSAPALEQAKARKSLRRLNGFKTPAEKLLDSVLKDLKTNPENGNEPVLNAHQTAFCLGFFRESSLPREQWTGASCKRLIADMKNLRDGLTRARTNLVNGLKGHFEAIAAAHQNFDRAVSAKAANARRKIPDLSRVYEQEVKRAFRKISADFAKPLERYLSTMWSDQAFGIKVPLSLGEYTYDRSCGDVALDIVTTFNGLLTEQLSKL